MTNICFCVGSGASGKGGRRDGREVSSVGETDLPTAERTGSSR